MLLVLNSSVIKFNKEISYRFIPIKAVITVTAGNFL